MSNICQSCLRAARQSRIRPFRGTPSRAVNASSCSYYSSTATRRSRNEQPTTPTPSVSERLQAVSHEVDKQSYLPNESTDPPGVTPSSTSSAAPNDGASEPSPDASSLSARLREQLPTSLETYVAYGATERLYATCSSQADYTIPSASDPDAEIPKTAQGEDVGVAVPATSWWYAGLGLPPTFSTWAQVTLLHMYMLHARFRLLPTRARAAAWNQHLTDRFFHDAERRMDNLHRISAASIRNRYLKDLFVQYRGVTTAYDEGLVRGDAALAAAVWRNLFKAAGVVPANRAEVARDVGEVDWVGVAQVVSYLRRNLARLDAMSDNELSRGEWDFGSPEEDRTGVLMGHAGLEQPFTDAP